MIRRSYHLFTVLPYTHGLLLRERGVHWDDFLSYSDEELLYRFAFLRTVNLGALRQEIAYAKDRLLVRDAQFFGGRLAQRDHYLLYDDFLHRAGFLDIETTGLSRERHVITTISVYDGKETVTLVRGSTLTPDALASLLSRFSMLVTFNGAMFDLPFIRAHFPGVVMPPLHVDLRFVCRRADLTGGLKRIEQVLGVSRVEEVQGVDGAAAVRLWKRFEKKGDKQALLKLIKYNQEDVHTLEEVAAKVLPLLAAR